MAVVRAETTAHGRSRARTCLGVASADRTTLAAADGRTGRQAGALCTYAPDAAASRRAHDLEAGVGRGEGASRSRRRHPRPSPRQIDDDGGPGQAGSAGWDR